MNRDLFLTKLREALQGSVSQSIINENISYYDNYIMQEIRKGKTEEEIFETLGNPRVLAQTIIETSGMSEEDNSYRENRGTVGDDRQDGFSNYTKTVTGGRAKLILIATVVAVILIIIGVFALLAGVISLIAPIIVPLLIIALVIRLFGRDR